MQQDKLSCGKCFPNTIDFQTTFMTSKQPSKLNYDVRIFYKTGKTNVEADPLSQIPR